MTSNFDFTDKTQDTISAAVQLAKDYANAQVHPAHLAFVLINEESAEDGPPGGLNSAHSGRPPLFSAVVQRAGGDPVAVKRGLQKLIVRLPSQSPPPDETTLSGAALKVLREANNIQKTMHDSYIAQDHLLRALIKDASISEVLKSVGLTEATLITAIDQI